LYEPFSGNILCEECGKIVPEEEAIIAGSYAVCSNRCALNLVGLGDL
jgi:endogenous inhibitor of DNA gyrase (YacG/DUF329 family)